MDKFQDFFLDSLVTEADDPALNATPEDDEAAFAASMDKTADPKAFSTDPLSTTEPGQSDYIETAKHWIHKLDQFSEELNGLDPGSLNSQLNEIDKEGSIFRGIVNDQSDDIVKVTEILKAMAEGIKGYIIGATRKQREMDSQRSL